MNLFLRLALLSVLSPRREAAPVLGPCRTPFRVLPTDLDVLRHTNNGVYLSLMDLARVDLLTRAGVASKVRERGWYPVVVAESITFRRSLTLGQRFEIETSVIGWDDRAITLSQDFWRGEQRIASAVVRAMFLGKDGQRVAPEQIVALTGEDLEAPVEPDWVRQWAQQSRIR
jgi:acyl-CoA thioesterase FadM